MDFLLDESFDFLNCVSSAPTRKPNKMLMPINNLSFSEADVAKFNKIYKHCLKMEEDGLYGRLSFTPSHGISYAIDKLRGAMWGITVKNWFIEIVIRHTDGRWFRFIIGYGKTNESEKKRTRMSGRKAFIKYKQELEKDGVDLSRFMISREEGLEVKKTIPSPKIELFVPEERTYVNAHHMDINSAYNAGMANEFPELAFTIKRMYNMRKSKTEFKDVLNMTQGFMQSDLVDYGLSHISKAGYVFTVRELERMAKKLEDNGIRVLAFNTDGIWYQSDVTYEDESFGTEIGQWKNDHKFCKLRFRSKGCYEYVEDGVYTPVFRGKSSFEKEKPREEWAWGDIFKGSVVNYIFEEGVGLWLF